MIGLLKISHLFSICHSRLKVIRNTLLVIHCVRWSLERDIGAASQTLLTKVKLHLRCRLFLKQYYIIIAYYCFGAFSGHCQGLILSHLTQVYFTLFYISCFPSQVPEPSRQDGEPERGPKPSSLEAPFVPPCKVKHKDALSALKRVKSERCKSQIYKTACLSEAKQLYNIDIKRTCPVPREKGSPAKWIDVAKTPYGNAIRIAYVVTVHGRAFRQVKRLFKALYHSHHYFFFHIDTVSR